MGLNDVTPCSCGSGKSSSWVSDARGIPLCRTCDNCHDEKMTKYRSEVLNNSGYDTDERVEDY